MCELTRSELGSHAMQEHDRAQWISLLRRDVELAVQAATKDPKQWADKIPWMPNGIDVHVAELAINGDYCEAGRLLFVSLRQQIMEETCSAEKERIYDRYGIDLDEVSP